MAHQPTGESWYLCLLEAQPEWAQSDFVLGEGVLDEAALGAALASLLALPEDESLEALAAGVLLEALLAPASALAAPPDEE